MISRAFRTPKADSFFLLGPRGTGKSSFIRSAFPSAVYIDLLEDRTFQSLLADPSRLSDYIPSSKRNAWVAIDEVQKIPPLLDEVHRLIEQKQNKFILTGSSARKLRRTGVNLLAGRAFTQHAYPLTAFELGDKFDIKRALRSGMLPKAYLEESYQDFLASYVATYLREEVQQEGLVRNIGTFSRFLEAASYSQAQVLNHSKVSADCAIERKTVANYFELLEDLLLSTSLDVFSLRSKRKLLRHRKFFFFDVGVFQQLRPRGPLDSDSEILGPALETLVLQEIMARNEYQDWKYKIHYWHTQKHVEVDFVLYGQRGLKAIEVKSGSKWRNEDISGLLEFRADYPKADLFLVNGGSETRMIQDVQILPAEEFLRHADKWL